MPGSAQHLGPEQSWSLTAHCADVVVGTSGAVEDDEVMEAEDVDGDVVADPDVPNDDVVTLKISQLQGVWYSGGSASRRPGSHSA